MKAYLCFDDIFSQKTIQSLIYGSHDSEDDDDVDLMDSNTMQTFG
jgi:hypothetical protein